MNQIVKNESLTLTWKQQANVLWFRC